MKYLLIFCFSIFLIPLSFAQSEVVSGVVVDENGTPLSGVSITVEGTTRGTVSDFNGGYSLRAESGEVLLFDFVGFKVERRTVGRDATDQITLLEDTQSLGEVILVGSRSKPRTAVESAVPVDVIDIKKTQELTGQTNVNQILQFSAPSFNSNQQSGSDGSDAIDPATLRGLGPDQTLVLVNGKRYHQSSLVNLYGTKGRGNTGTDLKTIPTAAIKSIEVLRDGASAQYGSDAIAGVINVVLEDQTEGVNVNLFTGANLFTSPGNKDVVSDKSIDGFTTDLSANYGFKIGDRGFGNITAEYVGEDYAFRNANPEKYESSRLRFGDAKSKNLYFFGNFEVPISDQAIFYSVPAFSHRVTDAYAWSRFPDDDNNINAIYPDGFNPIENTTIDDFTFNNGVKFNLGSWDLDLYNALGSNKFIYDIRNTLNATLEDHSPTSFDAGGHSLLQNTTGLSFARFFENTLNGLNLAFGIEFRVERFKQIKGEEGSYASYDINGDLVTESTPDNLIVRNPLNFDPDIGDFSPRPGGSQGFPGYSEEVSEGRNNIAGYIDVELDVTDNWMINGATRFENYSDFGNTLDGKLATRLKLSPVVAVRGSVSTGFRAPSLAQRYYSLNYTNFTPEGMKTIQLARNNSAVAQAVGIPSLKEEKSVNASLGFTLSTGKFSATVDGYFVRIKDRIVLTGEFDQDDDAIGDILVAQRVDVAKFFTNAIDTRTNGIDIILAYSGQLGAGDFTGTFAGNLNRMKITAIHTTDELKGKEDIYLEAREKAFILASAPNSKFNLNLNYEIDNFVANLQFTRFDKVRIIGYEGPTDFQDYTPRITTDLSFGYRFSKHISWIIGARNLFNRYPTLQGIAVDEGNTESGGIFDPVQMGFAGRQLFTSLNFKF